MEQHHFFFCFCCSLHQHQKSPAAIDKKEENMTSLWFANNVVEWAKRRARVLRDQWNPHLLHLFCSLLNFPKCPWLLKFRFSAGICWLADTRHIFLCFDFTPTNHNNKLDSFVQPIKYNMIYMFYLVYWTGEEIEKGEF